VLTNEQDGWNHIYRVPSNDGRRRCQHGRADRAGNWDVLGVKGVDEAGKR
jgi:hypothetical protein